MFKKLSANDGFSSHSSTISIAGEVLPTRRSPALGADTDTLLRGLGYSEKHVQDLHAKGVV
jgi:crotonobetainyl-CoA:carnitine CoA-transferase CaiB-like acyl-CoA transferase